MSTASFKPYGLRSPHCTALALLALAISQGASAETIKYYRNLVFRESPIEDYRGRHEIDADTAKKLIHFRFHYDDQDRLIEVSRRVGDTLTESDGSFPGFFWWAPRVKIEYAGGKETRWFTDVAGERTATHGKVFRMEFSLDEQGRRSRLNYFGQDGKPVDCEWGIHEYRWTHPSAGVVIEERSNLAGASATMRSNLLFHKVRLEFGSDELLDFVFNIDAKGELVDNPHGAAVDRIVYDLNHNFIRWQVYDQARRPKNGNDPKVFMGEYTYDANGNSLMLRGYGEQGENRGFSWSGGMERFLYDERGNLTSIGRMDLDGKLLREERLEYSADGTRVEWIKFLDGLGQPDPEAQYFALNIHYDAKGRREYAKPYNADMKPVRPPEPQSSKNH